ncbi:MAG TPA: DUF3300 domain-containing protein [Candidatus Synoicihabitans sp.]|nr:DUF3300 domain-containing protein [Candidatus Synoicihabitans sp.]
MHLRLLTLILVATAPAVVFAQSEPTPAPEIGAVRPHLRSEAELDQLLGPIALYPDALIALILPAATSPSDIVLLARQLATSSNLSAIEQEDWDDSVKALARYPEVVKWMDENLSWTRRVGEAFEEQPADVLNAVQRLRTKARAAGTLNDTPQQQVVVEEEEIRILPARPDVIYVPRYDPVVVYVERPYTYTSTFITFGIGYPVGHWLAYDCDWRRRSICYVPPPVRVRHWHESRDWRYRYRHDGGRDFDRKRWQVWNPHSSRRWDRDDRSRRRDDFDRSRRNHPPIATAPDVVVHPGGEWARPDFNRDRDESRRRHDQRRVGDPRPDRPVTDYRARRMERDATDPDRGATNPWRRGDNRDRGSTPGGSTPTVVAPVSPVPDLVRPAAPVVSPNGRRMPGSERNSGGDREYTRSPTGRVMSVQSAAPPPPPRQEPRAQSRFQRAEAAARSDGGGSRQVRGEPRTGGGRPESGRHGGRERD